MRRRSQDLRLSVSAETDGPSCAATFSYYNHYWARTDDDSGNKRVWLPVVWISGGVNDGPIPGLPHC